MSVLTHSRHRVPPTSPRAAGGLIDRALAWRRHVDRLLTLLTWKRARAYALVLLLLYVVAWLDVLALGSPPLNSSGTPLGGDYIAFHTAGRLLLAGRASEIYDHAAVTEVQDSLLGGRAPGFYDAFRNPPFYAVLFAPLALLDLLPGFAVFSVLSAACLALALWLLLRDALLLGDTRLLGDALLLADTPRLRERWRGLVVLVLAFPPVYFGLIDGENAIISLLLYALIYRAVAHKQDRAAGIWSALGLFKPQLFFIFPLIFLASRRWRALVAYCLTAAALFALSFAVVGPAGMQAWLRILIEPETGNATANAWRMASLKSFFDVLLPDQHLLSLGLYAASSLALLFALLRAWSRLTSRASSRPSSAVSSGPSAAGTSSGLSAAGASSGASPSGTSTGLSGGASLVISSRPPSSASPGGFSAPWTAHAAGSSSNASARPSLASPLPALWAFTLLVAVLLDPHLVDYDLTVLVPAAVIAASLTRHLRWWIVLLYVLTLFRAQLPIGDAALQLTTLVLGVLAILAWRAAAPTRPNPARPPQAASTQHNAQVLPT